MCKSCYVLAGLLFISLYSCDDATFITAGLSEELVSNEYVLIDHSFELAGSGNGNADQLYFEFIMNKELSTDNQVRFYDQKGNILALLEAGPAASMINGVIDSTSTRSYVYSMGLSPLKSVSLIKKVQISGE